MAQYAMDSEHQGTDAIAEFAPCPRDRVWLRLVLFKRCLHQRTFMLHSWTDSTSRFSSRSRTTSRSRSLFRASPLGSFLGAVLALVAWLPGQTFSASVYGTVLASAGVSTGSFGPATLPPGVPPFGGVAVVRSAPSPFGFALGRAEVGTTNDRLISSLEDTDGCCGVSGFASVQVTLTLQAPAGAGVRLTLRHTHNNPGPLGSTSATVTAAGQNWTSNGMTSPSPGTDSHVIDTIMPAGGLDVQVSHMTGGPFNQATLLVIWDYPGVDEAGGPTPGCLGPAVCWTQGIPELGNTGFGFTCANAHPGAGGVGAIGLGGVTTPWVYDFVDIWLDPNLPIATSYFPSSAAGDIFYPLPLPADGSFLGVVLVGQWVLLEPPGCMPLNVSGSNAVKATLQL